MSLGELNKLDMQSALHASRTASHSLNLKKERKKEKGGKGKKARKPLRCPDNDSTRLDLGLESRGIIRVLSFLVTVYGEVG